MDKKLIDKLVVLAIEGSVPALTLLLAVIRPQLDYYSRGKIKGMDKDDIQQEMIIYFLCRAVCKYDPRKGVHFRSYCALAFKGIWNDLKKQSDRIFKHIDNTDVELLGETEEYKDVDKSLDDQELCENIINTYSGLNKEIMLCLKDGKGYKAIAKQLKIKRKYIDNFWQRVRITWDDRRWLEAKLRNIKYRQGKC